MVRAEDHNAALARIATLENDIAEPREIIKELQAAKNATPATPCFKWSNLFQKNNAIDKTDSTIPIMLTMMQREQQSKAEKKNCITVNGLHSGDQPLKALKPESEKVINTFFSTLEIDPATEVKRKYLTKPRDQTKTPLLIVELKDEPTQQKALRSAKKLKDVEPFKKTYVNRDLTPFEHATEMKLREERNKLNDALEHSETVGGRPVKYGSVAGKQFYWGIRWGYLYKIDRATKKILA